MTASESVALLAMAEELLALTQKCESPDLARALQVLANKLLDLSQASVGWADPADDM